MFNVSTVLSCLSILASLPVNALSDHFWPGCHLYWRCAVLHLAPIGSAIQTFSQWAAYQNPVVRLAFTVSSNVAWYRLVCTTLERTFPDADW